VRRKGQKAGVTGALLAGLIVLGGLVVVSLGWAASGQTQPAGNAYGAGDTGAPAAQAQRTTAPSTQKIGVWHHFGENNGASSQQPTAASGWHSFGPPRTTPKAAPQPPPARVEHRPDRTSSVRTLPVPPARTARQPQYGASATSYMARQMFELINRDRMNPANDAEAGGRLRPLRWNAKLAAVARAHSLDMIRRGYFDHVDPAGRSPGDRIRAAGLDWAEAGENMAIAPTVGQGEASLMNEPRYQQNHRWNILNSKYTDVGVGIVAGPHGEYYITQDFMESAGGR
jgi:uncharacterized protein YkwD